MKKEDLKVGMLVEYRDGKTRMVMPYGLVDEYGTKTTSLERENDLKNPLNKGFDIMKVYDVCKLDFDFECRHRKLLWERKEIKLLPVESHMLRYLYKHYEAIERDNDGFLLVVSSQLNGYDYIAPFSGLFKFIKNGQQYNIKELLDNE